MIRKKGVLYTEKITFMEKQFALLARNKPRSTLYTLATDVGRMRGVLATKMKEMFHAN